MEVRLIKNYKNRHGKIIKKGTSLLVDTVTGRDWIKRKIARGVKDNAFTRLLNKGVDEGTKQTAKYKKKEKVDGDSREI